MTEVRHLLVVEDDANDATQIRRLFQNLEPQCTFFLCRNTSEARAYLKGAGMYEDRTKYPLPHALVSDIRLPEESGIDLIRWLRSEKDFAEMPIYIITGIASREELKTTQELGVELVLRKPVRLENLRTLLTELSQIVCCKTEARHSNELIQRYALVQVKAKLEDFRDRSSRHDSHQRPGFD